MLRLYKPCLALVGLALTAVPVEAGWHTFWTGVERDRQRNNCWPEPFVSLDRQFAKAPFQAMTTKGWQRQNLLGEHHFDPERRALSQAGQLKLRWILTQAPAEYRTVFVERGMNEEITAARMDVVQQAAAKLVAKGELPQVEISNMASHSWPADQVDNIERKYEESAPAPRMPAYESQISD